MSSLPYRDTKPQGAADFYFAINAMFRFILARSGRDGWIAYLREMATDYFAPVNREWHRGGLAAVAGYWRDFFAAEPGADVAIEEERAKVIVNVRRCPAIHHLRKHGRTIVPEFCQHCYFLGDARARAAGLAMRLEGGNGTCVHTYHADTTVAPQDPARIAEAR